MKKREKAPEMPHAQMSIPARKNVVRLVRNIRDQVGLAMLDLESETDSEKLQCRLVFIEEFSRAARMALEHGRSSSNALEPTG